MSKVILLSVRVESYSIDFHCTIYDLYGFLFFILIVCLGQDLISQADLELTVTENEDQRSSCFYLSSSAFTGICAITSNLCGSGD